MDNIGVRSDVVKANGFQPTTAEEDLAPRDVTINTLAFAGIRGGGLDSEFAQFGREQADIEATTERHAVRLGTEEEIAAIILFLCSPAARFISGSTIVADLGGKQRNIPFHAAEDFEHF